MSTTNKRKRDSPPSSPSTKQDRNYYPPNPNKRSLDTADNDGSNKRTTDQNMHPNLEGLRCRRCAYFENKNKNGGKSRKRRHSSRSSRHRHRHRHRRTSRH